MIDCGLGMIPRVRLPPKLAAEMVIKVYNVHKNTQQAQAMRTNIDLDDQLVEEAFRLTHLRTKKELLNLALQELIRSYKKRNLLDLSGKIQFQPDYDYKALRENRKNP